MAQSTRFGSERLLRDYIAETIRRVDGNHSMGAGALGEAVEEAMERDGWLVGTDDLIEQLVDHYGEIRITRPSDYPTCRWRIDFGAHLVIHTIEELHDALADVVAEIGKFDG
jgi:hypothetical protein